MWGSSVRSARHIQGLLVLLVACALATPAGGRQDERAMVVVPSGGPEGEQRLALLIGNAGYESTPLNNPVNDVTDMQRILKRLGFKVILRKNADRRGMEEAIGEFGQRLKDGGVGLFYYSGHGLQVDGRNYLIPVDAQIRTQPDVKYKSVDLGLLLDHLAQANNRVNIVILDACRDNPFSGFKSLSRGLAQTDAPKGTMVAYATAPGRVALDGDGRNGTYTKHLLWAMEQPGLPVEQVFKRVRRRVREDTDGFQIPWESSSLIGDFYFVPPKEVPGPGLGGAWDPEARVKQAWAERLEEMRAAFEDAQGYEAKTAPARAKEGMWQVFLDTFTEDNPYSGEDEAMRERGAERLAHWKGQEDSVFQPPPKPTGSWDPEGPVREAWARRLEEMRAAYEQAQGYEGRSSPVRGKQRVWQVFLETFDDDDPYSDEDEAMRAHGRKRLAHWKAQKDQAFVPPPVQTRPPPSGSGPPANPREGAREALAEYRAAYQARDFSRLDRVWEMNPDQRAAMQALFECADEIALEIDEDDVSVSSDGDRVWIKFDQKLSFSGPTCLMRGSGKRMSMTATVTLKSRDRWVISSILPSR